MPEFSEAANAVNASRRQNNRKGIICFDASLHDLKKWGGLPIFLTQCSNDGFGEDSDGARLTKAGGLGGHNHLQTECSRDGFGRDSYGV